MGDMVDEHQLLTAAAVRDVIYERQMGACYVCGYGMRAQDMDAHHRKRRRELGFCACNTIGLHHACHVLQPASVHQRPAWAKERGLIVPPWDDPRDVPVHVELAYPPVVYLRCDGSASLVERESS